MVYSERTGALPADVPTECRVPAGTQALSGTSTTRRLYVKVVQRNQTIRSMGPRRSQFLRQSFATAPKGAPWQWRALLRVPFCTRHLQHAKPFVYGPPADDAKLSLREKFVLFDGTVGIPQRHGSGGVGWICNCNSCGCFHEMRHLVELSTISAVELDGALLTQLLSART
jgi:hypothetical protein